MEFLTIRLMTLLNDMLNCLKLFILASLFLREENVKTDLCYFMVFSDAQPVQFWPIECNTYNEQQSAGVHHKCFCQPWQCDDVIKIQFTDTSDSSPDTPDEFELSIRDESGDELLSLPLDVVDVGARFVYFLSVIPNSISPNICNQFIQFVAVNMTQSGVDVYKTDCQDIRTEHPESILVNYRNHRNVFGLVYDDISPDADFNLRVPAIFFHQRFPKEEETFLLSTSMVSANSVVRKQRLLDVDYVPYYFHEKINLILQHQFVTIYNREWVTQEGYEILEGNRLWPVKKGKIYLSEKDFVMRNVL